MISEYKTLSDKKVILPIIIAIVFIIYGHYYPDDIQKPMIDKKINIDFDLWSLTHFVLFFYFGLIYPKKLTLFFIIGVIWELIEDYLAKNESTKLVDCNVHKDSFWCNGFNDGYWYGKLDDVIVNCYGFLLGSYIASSKKLNLQAVD